MRYYNGYIAVRSRKRPTHGLVMGVAVLNTSAAIKSEKILSCLAIHDWHSAVGSPPLQCVVISINLYYDVLIKFAKSWMKSPHSQEDSCFIVKFIPL